MFRNLMLASAIVAFTGSFGLLAQQDNSAAKNRDDKPADHHAAHNPDHMMASCVAVSNQEEIALAEFARQKTTNDDVKKLVEMMITDHHTFLLKLKKFAPEATQPGYIDTHARGEGKDDAGASATNKPKIQKTGVAEGADDAGKGVQTADANRSAEHHVDFAQMQRELAAECLALSKEKLSQKEGAEFDKCFVGQQIAMHEGMKAKLIVFQRHASGDLAKVFAEGQKTTEHHLAKAEELMKHLSPSTTIIEKTRDGKNKERTVIKEKADK